MFGKILEYNLSQSSIIFLDSIPRSGMYQVQGLNLLNSWCIPRSRKVIPIYTSITTPTTLPPPVSFWPESKHRWWAMAPKEKKEKKKTLSLHKQRADYKYTDLKGEKQRVLPGAQSLDLLTPVPRKQLQAPCTGPPSSRPLQLWVHHSLCWNTSACATHCQPSCFSSRILQ